MTRSNASRFGAALLCMLVFVHAGAGLVHACCMDHGTGDHGMDAPAMAHGVDAPSDHHASHAHNGSESDESEGNECGLLDFCCQPANDDGLPTAQVAVMAALEAVATGQAYTVLETFAAAPDFWLPYPNGPPTHL